MLKFCPECGNKVTGGRFCGSCGTDLSKYEERAHVSENTNGVGIDIDGAIGELIELQKEYERPRALIIRGKYDEAKQICEERLDKDPLDKLGYLGLIRIASKNYTTYESAAITEQIRIAEQVFGGSDALLFDSEYAQYIVDRKKYFEDKEQKRIEAEKAEEERKRKEAEKAEIERMLREKAEMELSNCMLTFLRDYSGTYMVTGVKDKYIKNVIIPDCVSIIGKEAFNGCILTSITMPNSIVRIEDRAFSGCENLTSVIIPDSVVSIGSRAFWGCHNLTSIALPDSLNSIGEGAFMNCRDLTSIDIPNSVKKISSQAFWGCSSLSSVSIPDSVELIENSAFYYCENLKNVSLPYYCQYTWRGRDRYVTSYYGYGDGEMREEESERSFPVECTVTKRNKKL